MRRIKVGRIVIRGHRRLEHHSPVSRKLIPEPEFWRERNIITVASLSIGRDDRRAPPLHWKLKVDTIVSAENYIVVGRERYIKVFAAHIILIPIEIVAVIHLPVERKLITPQFHVHRNKILCNERTRGIAFICVVNGLAFIHVG